MDIAADLYLRRHPWRTLDPAKALLFFVPLFISSSIVCGSRLPAVQKVLSSPSYSNGKGHFTVAADWSIRKEGLAALKATTSNSGSGSNSGQQTLTLGAGTFGFEAKVRAKSPCGYSA